MKTIINPQDFDAILRKYQGAYAQIWLFHVSHKRLALRLSIQNNKEVLYLVAVSCEHIIAPFSWKNADLSISKSINEKASEIITKVTDNVAGVELISSGGIGLALGDQTDFDKSFENFLGDIAGG